MLGHSVDICSDYIFHYISFSTNDAMTDGLFRLNDFLHAFDNRLNYSF